ncbi:MAG TPA: SusC/RagA family TonB-linked outer membrane protein, partial [Cyclobacteriaceae bacterium]|nr:SusC/RagA family TonB-linked outer membrane protein [Cyclobacteriaceae bacterium]
MMRNYLINRYLRWCCFSIALLSLASLANAQEELYSNAKQTNTYSRQTKRSLKDVLPEIQAHFKISFVYESGVIDGKEVTGEVPYSRSIDKTLNTVLKPVGLKYRKVNKSTYSILSSSISSTITDTSIAGSNLITSSVDGPVIDVYSNESLSSLSFQEVDKVVTGRVTDDTDTPLPGVNVLIKGTNTGTTTEADGRFSISVPDENAVLIISFIGYTTQEISVGTSTQIDIKLVPDVTQLSEVVVVGYGTQKRSSVTGAVTSVSSREIAALPVPSVSAALQGRVPGVFVTNNGGPGTNAIVRIRGIGSITQNADPLYVVDGFPAPNFNLNSVDTKDIESVEILKDAAATAIYGSRAANGVVLITTKLGSKDQRIHVDIEAYAGAQSAWKELDLLKRDQYLSYGTALLTNAGGSPPSRFSNMNAPIYAGTTQTFAETETDWQDEMFRAAPISQLQGSISGSTEKSKLYFSFGRFKQDGTMLGTSYDRYNARLGIETNISKRFKFGENVQVTQSNNFNQLESSGRTMIMHMLRSVPYITVHNPNTVGGFNGPTTADGSDPENPVRLATMDKRTNHNFYILSNTFVQANIVEGLKYKFTFGVNYSVDRAEQNDPIF